MDLLPGDKGEGKWGFESSNQSNKFLCGFYVYIWKYTFMGSNNFFFFEIPKLLDLSLASTQTTIDYSLCLKKNNLFSILIYIKNRFFLFLAIF